MLPTRIALISGAFFVAALAAAWWAQLALDHIRPEEEGPFAFAAMPWAARAPVSSGSGLSGELPSSSDVRSVEALIVRLRAAHEAGADWAELSALADAAVRFGRAAVLPLARVAHSSAEAAGVRLLAAEMLGRIDEPESVPALLECAAERMPEHLRLTALDVLASHPHGAARVAYLFTGLARFDPVPNVRARAAGLLARFPGPGVTDLLCRAARQDESPGVRLNAVTALGTHLDEASVPTLREVIRMDLDAAVRTAAVEAAGNYREPRLREFFHSVLEVDEDAAVKAAARRQLWRIPAD
jgi:HEAT repeat protein